MKLMKTTLKNPWKVFPGRCGADRETRRFNEKLGDSRENRESWQVWTTCICSQFLVAE